MAPLGGLDPMDHGYKVYAIAMLVGAMSLSLSRLGWLSGDAALAGAALLSAARIRVLPDTLEALVDIQAYRQADVIIGNRLDVSIPAPERGRRLPDSTTSS